MTDHDFPWRPAGAVDRRAMIPLVQQWEQYRGKVTVVDCYSLPHPTDANQHELKVVTRALDEPR